MSWRDFRQFHPAFFSTSRRCMCVRAVAFSLFCAAFAALLSGCRRSAEPPDLVFPLKPLDQKLESTAPPSPWNRLNIVSVSADGRRLWVRAPMFGSFPLIFDVHARRFVASVQGVYQWPIAGWTSQRMIVVYSQGKKIHYETDHTPWCGCDCAEPLVEYYANKFRPRSSPHFCFFYEADVENRTTSLLFKDTITIPQQRIEEWEMSHNKSRSALAYSVKTDSANGDSSSSKQYFIADLQTGGRHAVFGAILQSAALPLPRGPQPLPFFSPKNRTIRSWGWLPDDRTLILHEAARQFARLSKTPPYGTCLTTDNLHIVALANPAKPRCVSLTGKFNLIQAQGTRRKGESPMQVIAPIGFPPPGGRVRFLAAPVSYGEYFAPTFGQGSVWDLDLETGDLQRVMDLQGSVAHFASVAASPSGASLVVPCLSPVAMERPSTAPIALTLYTVGRPPRNLPFQLTVPMISSPAYGCLPCLYDILVFLDDNTLVYNHASYELWRFDLQSEKSERLWSPAAGPGSQPSM